jgi:hypothetical protein
MVSAADKPVEADLLPEKNMADKFSYHVVFDTVFENESFFFFTSLLMHVRELRGREGSPAGREGALLSRVDDGGADELAGDAAAEELADAVDDGAADAGDVQAEHGLAHEHRVALEVRILVAARDVADDGDLSDVSEHLRFYYRQS